MASVNKAIVLGNIGRDPEVRYSASGSAVCNLSIATTRKWKSKDGEAQEETEWHRVVLYDRLAEVADEYLGKGSAVYVEGRLKTRKWQDKDGNDRYSTEVVLQGMNATLTMLDGPQGAGTAAQSYAANRQAGSPSSAQTADYSDLDSDIPF